MDDASLEALKRRRDRLDTELAATGDFRRSSISENHRRCGKPNCACAHSEDPGHGPRYLWTRTVPGRGTKGRQLSAGEVDKVRSELANYQRFADLSERIVAVNESICEARPPNPAATASPAGTGDEKGAPRAGRRGVRGRGRPVHGACRRLARPLWSRPADGGTGDPHRDDPTRRRAAATADVRRHRAPRPADRLRGRASRRVRRLPRQEHRHRLGPDRAAPRLLPRCGIRRGIVPRDEDLGVAAVSLLPGLRRMTARAAAAEPFATAAELLAELAGIQLSDKRIERSAETNGAAAAEHITAEAEAITHRTVAVLPAPADRGKPPDKLYIAIDLDREGWCRYDRPLLVQPITPDDTADILAEVATGEPQGRYVDVAGPETQDLVDTARRTNEVRGRKVKRVRTWSGIFGGSVAGNVLLPGEDARIAPTTFDDRLAAGAR